LSRSLIRAVVSPAKPDMTTNSLAVTTPLLIKEFLRGAKFRCYLPIT
jgi:hypothetical protein